MSDGPYNLAELQTAIVETRRHFYAQRERLEESLGRSFDDPASAADVLLSLAEEYGPEQAVALLRERPFDVGELLPEADLADDLEAHLSDIMQTQDHLDDLTAEREKLVPQRDGMRVVNIQGEAYELDGRELRSVDRPDGRHPVDLEQNSQPELGLAETIAAKGEVPLAQPREQPGRERSRGR